MGFKRPRVQISPPRPQKQPASLENQRFAGCFFLCSSAHLSCKIEKNCVLLITALITNKILLISEQDTTQSYSFHHFTFSTSAIFFAISTGSFLLPVSYRLMLASVVPTRSANSATVRFLFFLISFRYTGYPNVHPFPRSHLNYIMKEKHFQQKLPIWY